MNGIYNHQPFFLGEELGMSPSGYGLIASSIFVFAIIGKLLFGLLSDRLDKILMMIIVVATLIVGLVLLRISGPDNRIILYGYAAVFGLGFGGTFTMIQLVIAEFFEGRSFGRILGILTAVDVASGGIAISVLALMSEHYGSYLPVIEYLIGLNCIVAVLVALLYRIRRSQMSNKIIA
jgi:MFS family permease